MGVNNADNNDNSFNELFSAKSMGSRNKVRTNRDKPVYGSRRDSNERVVPIHSSKKMANRQGPKPRGEIRQAGEVNVINITWPLVTGIFSFIFIVSGCLFKILSLLF